MIVKIDALFERHCIADHVVMPYLTRVCQGASRSSGVSTPSPTTMMPTSGHSSMMPCTNRYFTGSRSMSRTSDMSNFTRSGDRLVKRGVAVWTHAVVEQRRFELPRGLVNHRGTCLEGLGTWPGRAREGFMFLVLRNSRNAFASHWRVESELGSSSESTTGIN